MHALRCTAMFSRNCVIYFSWMKLEMKVVERFASHRSIHYSKQNLSMAITRMERKSIFAWLTNIIVGAALISAIYQSLCVHFFTPTCAQHIITMRLEFFSFRSSQSASFDSQTIINFIRNVDKKRSYPTTCALTSSSAAVWIAKM
jgi:hypothetical protein